MRPILENKGSKLAFWPIGSTGYGPKNFGNYPTAYWILKCFGKGNGMVFLSTCFNERRNSRDPSKPNCRKLNGDRPAPKMPPPFWRRELLVTTRHSLLSRRSPGTIGENVGQRLSHLCRWTISDRSWRYDMSLSRKKPLKLISQK